jgi:hypothetical protein
MAKAVADLVKRGEAVTSRLLAAAAHISLKLRLRLAPAAGNGRREIGSSVISSAR